MHIDMPEETEQVVLSVAAGRTNKEQLFEFFEKLLDEQHID